MTGRKEFFQGEFGQGVNNYAELFVNIRELIPQITDTLPKPNITQVQMRL